MKEKENYVRLSANHNGPLYFMERARYRTYITIEPCSNQMDRHPGGNRSLKPRRGKVECSGAKDAIGRRVGPVGRLFTPSGRKWSVKPWDAPRNYRMS